MLQIINKIIIVMISLALSCFCLELVLREFHIPKFLVSEWSLNTDYRAADPNICFTKPSFYSRVQYKKRKNEQLIIALGDSFTEGYPVESLGYPEVLQQKFVAAYSPNVKVANFGMGDSGTDQQLRLFKDFILPVMRPNIVIWSLYPNDISDNVDYAMYTISAGNTLQKIDCRTSFLYVRRLIDALSLPGFVKQSNAFRVLLKSTEWLISSKIPKQFKTDVDVWGYKKLELAVDEMNALSKKYNFEVFYVFIAPQCVYQKNCPDWNMRKYNMIKRISERITNEHIIIDMNFRTIVSADFQNVLGTSTGVDTTLYVDETQDENALGDRHFNEKGYQVFADLVFNVLMKKSAIFQNLK